MGTKTVRQAPVRAAGPRATKGIFEAVSKVVREGKSAIASLASKQLESLEYVLTEDRLLVGTKEIPFAAIRSVEMSGGSEFVVRAASKSVSITPYAWLEVAGHRVPLGWLRDGMEVPFELLAEEIAARAGVEIRRP